MNDAAQLTARQKLLLAAASLEDSGVKPFTAEAWTVQAWKDNRPKFGLKGFENVYPCSNSTFTNFMGERGLAHDKYVKRVGPRLYELTELGRAEVERLRNGNGDEPKRRELRQPRLSKAIAARLSSLFLTTAWRRWQQSLRSEITYRDAREFWFLQEHENGDRVSEVLCDTLMVIVSASKMAMGGEVQLSDRQVVGAQCLGSLEDLHNWLVAKFADQLQRQREGRFRRIGT